jgi:hypothetical protein
VLESPQAKVQGLANADGAITDVAICPHAESLRGHERPIERWSLQAPVELDVPNPKVEIALDLSSRCGRVLERDLEWRWHSPRFGGD